MDFLVVTYTPAKQGLLGVIPPNVDLSQQMAENEEDLKTRLAVPLEGYCLIINKDNITTVTSQIVNQEVEELPENIQTPQV